MMFRRSPGTILQLRLRRSGTRQLKRPANVNRAAIGQIIHLPLHSIKLRPCLRHTVNHADLQTAIITQHLYSTYKSLDLT